MAIERHVFSILVQNEAGVLVRVLGLFAARGYNIESLSVAEVDAGQKTSCITLVSSGTAQVIEQIARQLARLVPVLRVDNLTTQQGMVLERELMLVVLRPQTDALEALRALASQHHATVHQTAPDVTVLEISATSSALDALLGQLQPYNVQHYARTGITAVSTGITRA